MKTPPLPLISLLFFVFVSQQIGFGQSAEPYRIAILGCHRQFEPAPAFVRYVESQPDLCLWLGDNIYADTQTDIDHLQACYDAMAAKPAFQQLMQAAPYVATWDDHDYGDNNEWKDYPLKAESKALFRRFWELEDKIPQEQEGIYYAEQLDIEDKKIQIILLDVRYHRDAPGPEADMLGKNQWVWLETQLNQPADLRLIVSGTQILLPKETGSETWDEYPKARQRLFELIRTTGAEGVVFLTGDQHYGEVCRMAKALDVDAVELQFAGINQIETAEFNPLRVASASTSLHSYALLDLFLESTETDVPHLLFQIFDAMTNELELKYRVNLSELFLDIQMDRDSTFANDKRVTLSHHYPRLVMRYTLDDSEPTAKSPIYQAPLEIEHSTQLKVRLFDRAGNARSQVFSQYYEKLEIVKSVKMRNLAPGLSYRYFEGDFKQLSDVDQLKPVKEGTALDLKVDKLGREDHFAVTYTGYYKAPASGLYTFTLISDDGSALYFHDKLVVNNDGSHSRRKRQGRLALEAGWHPIRIQYFEDYDGQSLEIREQGPDLPDQFVSFEKRFFNKP